MNINATSRPFSGRFWYSEYFEEKTKVSVRDAVFRPSRPLFLTDLAEILHIYFKDDNQMTKSPDWIVTENTFSETSNIRSVQSPQNYKKILKFKVPNTKNLSKKRLRY